MKDFSPMDSKKITKEELTKAIASLVFLKEKCDGSVKVRACENGSKKHT